MSAVTIPRTGTTIEYSTFGDPAGEAVLLVVGYQTAQVGWDEQFCALLAEGGHYVIRFDNRDIGRSTKHPDDAPPYSLCDLADDAAGLLEALGIDSAHVVGGSLGGMIAQHLVLDHPERVRTLTLLMSTTFEPDVQPDFDAVAALMADAPTDPVEAFVATASFQSGGRYLDADYLREQATIAVDYGLYPESATRQLTAMLTFVPLVERLALIDVPTLVVHGRNDPLMPLAASERLAQVIPGAHLLVLDGMGHELPPPLWPVICGSIHGITRTHTQGEDR